MRSFGKTGLALAAAVPLVGAVVVFGGMTEAPLSKENAASRAASLPASDTGLARLFKTAAEETATGTVVVGDAAELVQVLRSARGGDVVLLRPGDYEAVSLRKINFDAPVRIASLDPARPAVIGGLSVRLSSNLIFENLVFSLPSATRSSFGVRESSDIVIRSVKVTSAEQDVAKFPFGIIVRQSERVSVLNNEMTRVRWAVAFNGVTDLRIESNYIHDIRADGIGGGNATNLFIRNNFITDLRSLHGDHEDGIQMWNRDGEKASNIVIEGNVIAKGDGVAMQGIFLKTYAGVPYDQVVIAGNLMIGTIYHGIHLPDAVNSSIRDNTVLSLGTQKSWILTRSPNLGRGNRAAQYLLDGKGGPIDRSFFFDENAGARLLRKYGAGFQALGNLPRPALERLGLARPAAPEPRAESSKAIDSPV